VLRLNDEIIGNFPQSDEAKSVIQKRWHDEHPVPIGPQPNEGYTRELLTTVREWHKQWPNDPTFVREIFTAVNDLPHSTPEQLAQAADDLLTTDRNGANAAWPMLLLQVAEAYVKRTKCWRRPNSCGRELGGSGELYAMLGETPQLAEETDQRWEAAQESATGLLCEPGR
jgi:hypothetical protein